MQKQTTLANELWPLLLPRINKLLAGSPAGGGGAVGEHELGGAKHTGVLRTDQAPWAVTDAELSAHAGDPDAHHARQHLLANGSGLGPDHTVSGASAGWVLRATASNAARFMALSHNDLGGVTEDQHHARQHDIVGGDHTLAGAQWQIVGAAAANSLGLLTPSFNPGAAAAVLRTNSSGALTLPTLTVDSDLFMDGTLDFGTDTMYEDATYLQVTGSKAVRFGQNIGNANWTIYNAGGAEFRGNLDVLNGGDLYVAGSGFYAGNPVLFADSSGGNVGILRVPDPQFALDVAGPARAQYFIGPHAIQLKNALLIAHYDGPERGPLGEKNGHMGQVAAVTGDVVHRLGKFNKAVEVSSAYTNLIANPSFEADVSGWSSYSTGTAAGTRARTNEEAWDGAYSYRLSKTGGGNADRYGLSYSYSVTNGQAYSLSVRVKVTEATGAAGNLVTFRTETNVTAAAAYVTTVDNEWLELTLSTTATATGTATIYVWLANCTTATVYVDALQVTATGAQRPFWAGGARAAGTLTYSNLAVNWNKCTVMAWFRTEDNASALARQLRIFEVRVDANNTYRLSIDNATNMLVGYLAGAGVNTGPTGITTVTPRAWHHVALVVNGATVQLYLDGVAEDTNNTLTGSAAGAATAYVGCGFSGDQLNGLIDEFALINDALDAAGVRAVYESNAPVFAESSVWSWRATPKGLVWADDEGLWMRDVSGNPVLGVYGGEAATKSWGGFSLAVGDVVIGRNAVGAAALMWDQSTGKFGWYGGGNGTPYTEIGTDGSITAINATLSGTITAASGAIGGWTIDTAALIGTNIKLYSGNAFTARIELGDGTAARTAGIRAGGNGTAGDTAMWAGAAHTDTGNAKWRVTLGGTMYATDADVTGAIKATSGYIGGTAGGWAIGSNQITSTGIGLYAGAANTARLQVGSGSNMAGVVSPASGAAAAIWAGASYANRDSAPFVVQADGTFYADAAILDGAAISNANVSSLYAGNNAVKLGTDGQRFLLPNTTGIDVPTSSSALRWFPTIDGTHDASKNYTGLVGYRHTTYNTVDMLYTAYVGSTDYATYAARFILQAGHSDGTTYTDTRLEIVREAGGGARYIGVYGDRMEVNGAIRLAELSATPAIGDSGVSASIYVKGDKFIIAYNDGGTVRYKYLTLNSTGVTWSYTATEP